MQMLQVDGFHSSKKEMLRCIQGWVWKREQQEENCKLLYFSRKRKTSSCLIWNSFSQRNDTLFGIFCLHIFQDIFFNHQLMYTNGSLYFLKRLPHESLR